MKFAFLIQFTDSQHHRFTASETVKNNIKRRRNNSEDDIAEEYQIRESKEKMIIPFIKHTISYSLIYLECFIFNT